MLSLASRDGPKDEELIREIEHLATQLIPEFIRRFDARVDPEDNESEESPDADTTDLQDQITELEAEVKRLNARIADLESDLALIS